MTEDRLFSFNVDAVNLIIGLCLGMRGLPRDIHDLGYAPRLIEAEFPVSDGEALVRPDVVIGSEPQAHTLLTECKSGVTFKEDQARRYGALTPRDLVQGADLPVPETALHDCLYLVTPSCVDAVDCQMAQAGHRFPIASLDRSSFRLARRHLSAVELDALLSEGIDISGCEVIPRSFLPFDVESSDWEVAQYAATGICSLMHSEREEFTVDELAQTICVSWQILGPDYRSNLRDKLRRVVNGLADTDLGGYFERKPKASASETAAWRVLRNPATATHDRRTTQWQTLFRRCNNAVQRLRGGQPQLPLE